MIFNQNIEEQKGFQIFIIPYFEEQVALDRHRPDAPGGRRGALRHCPGDHAAGHQAGAQPRTQ